MTKKPTVPQNKTKAEKFAEACSDATLYSQVFEQDEFAAEKRAAYICSDTGNLELESRSLSRTDALRLRDFITEWFDV